MDIDINVDTMELSNGRLFSFEAVVIKIDVKRPSIVIYYIEKEARK